MTDRSFVIVGAAAETTITVSRASDSLERPQGIVLDADHPLEVGDARATRIVLWSDTAPKTTEVITTEAGEIRLWNVWRDGDLIQSWQATASMTIDDAGEDLGISCRDGHGSRLDLALSFDRAWTQPADD
jgi:hypothetical protein